MILPGQIYHAVTDSGVRPAVIVSRAELNRGRWVVAILITSAQFHVRAMLPHCVAFRAGEFGLTKDCVAQAEAVTFLDVTDLDLDAGVIGTLDESRLRELIRAMGNMMASDCEPE